MPFWSLQAQCSLPDASQALRKLISYWCCYMNEYVNIFKQKTVRWFIAGYQRKTNETVVS